MKGALSPSRKLRLYMQLSKDKLSLWIVLSTLPGYFFSGGMLMGAPLASLVVGTGLCSAAANAINQTYERKRDYLMHRTRNRPVASGLMTPKQGYGFAATTGLLGTGVLSLGCGDLTALLGLGNIIAYGGIYTPMKVKSEYNTHIGAVVGSIPVLMGCTAAGMSLLSPLPISLFIAQTLWQFPHFYALAWLHRQDYIKGGFRMFPLKDETGIETARMIKPWMMGLTLFPVGTWMLGWTSGLFFWQLLCPNLFMWRALYKFEKDPSRHHARRFFFHSLWQLFALLGLTAYHTSDASLKKKVELIAEEDPCESELRMIPGSIVIHSEV